MQMESRHMKRCPISLIIREVQIKTIVRYHLTLIRMAIIKKYINKKVLERPVERRECPYTVGGNVSWYS